MIWVGLRRLHFFSGNHIWNGGRVGMVPLNKWSTITIAKTIVNEKPVITYHVNGEKTSHAGTDPNLDGDEIMKLYACYLNICQTGFIRNITVHTQHASR